MDKDKILTRLYDDYRTITADWAQSLIELTTALDSRNGQQQQLRDLKADQELMKAHAILGETHKEGHINGKNAETRKLQTTMLLGILQENDPDWIQLLGNIRLVEACGEYQLALDVLPRF